MGKKSYQQNFASALKVNFEPWLFLSQFFVIFFLQINVLVDTGSSNFAVAASPHPYLPFYFHTDK